MLKELVSYTLLLSMFLTVQQRNNFDILTYSQPFNPRTHCINNVLDVFNTVEEHLEIQSL